MSVSDREKGFMTSSDLKSGKEMSVKDKYQMQGNVNIQQYLNKNPVSQHNVN